MAAKGINLNVADVEDLAELRMIGRERAESIIGYREEYGPFQSWEDLEEIPGFSDMIIEDLKKSGATL